jgi:predicted RNase H-like HicB family nuclease
MKPIRISLRIVFYREDEFWVAHCLEFDLMGHGATKKEALSLLTEAIEAQALESLSDNNLGNLFTPADGKFLAMWATGKDVVEGQLEIKIEATPLHIDESELREYSGDNSDFECSERELVPA